MKKRIIALLLAVVMLLGYVPVPATATEHTHPTFVVDTVTASAGETVDVTIRLENNPGITSIKLKVEYADGLTLVGVTGNPDLGRNFLVSPDGVYPVILNWYDGLADVTGDWVFATLQFTVADGADAGEYPVTISYNPNDVFDVNEDNVSFEIANGAVVVDSHYGRQQLAGMSNAKALLYAYDRIVAGIEASAEHIEVYNGADPLSVAELQMVMDVYGRDYAHHFWMDNGYSYSSDPSGVVSLMPRYVLSGSELETAKAAFEQKVAGILEGLTDSMSEYERELYLHDQLAEIITYADGDNAHNAYGALVEGKAVCEGYAEALQYLLQRAGIQSFIALGSSINPTTNSSEGHAWNYVRIDGEYYHVDLTWNDQDENLFHAYFNQPDAVIRENHAVSEVSYTLPTCDSVDAQYFTGKDTYLDDYTVAEVGRLLKNNGLTVHVYLPGDVDGFITWYYTNIVDIAIEAGVSGGFSYGYTRLGRELILAIATACDHSGLTLQAGADASCAADGYKAYYKCSCGKYFEDSSASVEITDLAAWKAGAGKIPASHDLTEVPATEATCDKDGNVAYFTCDCGKWFWDAEATQGIADKNSVVIKALNHSFTNYVSDNNATCAQDGTETAKCDHCEETDTRVISGSREDAAHTFPLEYTSDGNADCTTDGTKSRVCTTCGEKETVTDEGSALGHRYQKGVCTICGDVTSLAGKKISILGDSISTYVGVSNDASVNPTLSGGAIYYTAGRLGVYQPDTWWQQTVDNLGLELLVNNSWSGSCIFNTRSGTVGAYVDRSVQLHNVAGEEPDIIAVYLGTNDFSVYKSTLGTAAAINYETLITEADGIYTYATPATAAEAYAIMIHKAMVRYPNAEIYCFTLLQRLNLSAANQALLVQFNETIAAIADHFGAIVVDLYNDSGIKADSNFQYYVADNAVHPGPAGMDAITGCFTSAILEESRYFSGTAYDVTYQLSGTIVNQGTAKAVQGGKPFSCDLTASAGELSEVTVTMGGQDITTDCYANGKITIAEVTGDIVITATSHAHSYTSVVTAPTCTAQGYTTYTCACGDSYVSDYVDALGHKLGDWATTKDATCTEDGSKRRDCDRCDYFETEAIKATGHKYESVVTAPTCTEDGYTTHTCHCGDSYVDSKVDALGHKLGNWETTKDATCTEDGSKRRDCDRCDYFETEAIKATGHKYESVVTAPTCTEDGYTTHTCHCGDSYVDSEVDALGHKLGDWATTKDATCTEDGSKRRDCERCDYFETEVIEATGHKYESVVTAPTCTAEGYTTHTCRCGDSYVDSKVDALGHEYGEWTEVKAPTCDTEGQDKRICDTCGDAQYRDTRISGDPNKILVSNPVAENHYAGKKMVFLGDSVTWGSFIDTVRTDAYPYVVGNSLGATVSNKAVSGSSICTGGHVTVNESLTYETIKGADVVTILLGVNDFNHAVKNGMWQGAQKYDPAASYYDLGDYNSTDTSEYFGALRAWCEKIAEFKAMPEFENTEFIFITMPASGMNRSVSKVNDWDQSKVNIHGRTLREYCTAIMEICAEYGIPVFDANMYSGIYYNSPEDNNVDLTGGDGVHPSAAGHALIAKSLEEFLLEGYTYENRTVADCGHRYETVITQPTCTEDGYTTHKCPVCHYSYTDNYVDALGHKYESVVTAPTCTKAGYTTNTCHCGDSYVDSYVPALGHDWDAGVVTKEPTETETGLRLHNCTRCDESKTETIPTLDHAHKYEAVVTAPTCTEQGYTTHTCRCGDSYVDTYVPATGHTNVDVPAIKANSARPGMTEGVKCGVCGEILEAQQVIPAKGYDWMLDDGAFKILLIGNSYSEDASSCGQGMNESQLLNILQSMLGDDVQIVVGLAYSGGKGLNWHATQADQGKASHSLRVISTGSQWASKGRMVLCDALEWTDWDVVSLQHYNINPSTGEESLSYPEQTDSKFYKMEVATEYLLDYVDEFAPQADTYFYTHWAQTSTLALNAAKSQYDKLAVYIPVVMDYVGTESGNRFANLIPVGLSIQNARTTYLAKLAYNTTAYADKNLNLYTDAQIGLQRDGGHVSFNIGRYIAGLTFAETIIPEEMRVAGYVLPEIRVTESVGKLPGEYTQIAQKSVFAAVESWRNGSLAVTNIEGYSEDPIVVAEETLKTMSLTLNCGNAEKQIEMLVLAELPADFAVETIQLDAEKEMATVAVRFGYSFATVQIPFTQAKHTHTAVVTAPTCTEQGYTTHTCRCGDEYIDTYVDALGHKLGDWETVKDATCTEDGSKRRDCDRCDYFETEVIKATGHKYEAVVTAPTCTEQGYTTHTCYCGDSYVDSKVDALGHKLGDWATTKDATCTEDGSKRRDCDRCDYFETEVIEAIGHKYEEVVTAPTCTEQGYTTHTCHCGDSYVDSKVDALGHKLGDWETTKDATCTEDGSKRRDCERCDYFETEVIEATGHKYESVVTAPTCTAQGYTTYTCHCGDSYVSDYVDALGHKYESVVTAPTCTKAGYTTNTCAVCGDNDVNGYVPALGHKLGDWATTKDATCTEDGSQRRDCERCDYFETEVIEATGHKYESVVTAPTCTEEGYTTHTCHCGDSYVDSKVDALGHKLGDWETTKDATCTEDGSKRRDCDRCDYFETEVIKATGHKYESVVTAPTCTEDGYTTHTCHCGDSYVDSKVDALGHKLGDWETVKAATCTEDGSQRRDCDRCDYFETEVIEATGHKYESVVTAPTCTEEGYTTHTCACGDSYVSDYVDALGHKLGDWETVKAATCTEDGSQRRDCERCDYFETETIEATGHKYESVVTAPTCTKAGYTTNTCAVCGDNDVNDYVPALGHDWDAGVVTKEPTEEETGTRLHNCNRCDETKTVTIPTLDHVHKYEAVVTAPTCTEEGYTTHTCHCGDSYVDSKVDALGHKLGDWETTKDATCTEDGSKRRDCDRCDYFETEVIETTGHKYESVVTAPTCTEDGYATYTCECGDSYVSDYVDALGHKLGDWETTKDATCTEKGSERRDCANCDHYETREIEATGHKYESVVTAPTCTEDGYTTYACECGDSYVSDYVDALGHDLVSYPEQKPTCVKDGWEAYEACSRCEYTTCQPIPAKGHQYSDTVIPPTCTAEGYTLRECTVCGINSVIDYVDALGHKEVILKAVAPTCTATGLTEGSYCASCGKIFAAQQVVAALGHSYKSVVTAPTCTAEGYTTYTCHCGHSYVDNKVSALGHKLGQWTVFAEPKPDADGEERRTCQRCDFYESRKVAYPGIMLKLEGEDLTKQKEVWIEGMPYPVITVGDSKYVELQDEKDFVMVTYTYQNADNPDVHTQYPTGMKVYKVSGGKITHIKELDNLLQYSGSSIRITGKKGIRMITSLTKANKTALTGKGLAGYKLVEYGTALCWASEIKEGDALTLGKTFTRSNYAYKRGVADPIFATTKDLVQYTNVLVGFTNDQCKDDIAMRPYIILEDAKGEKITLYGGTVYRSIGYIAYQNRSVVKAGTEAYKYVWDIIHYVYGNKYDADYKG